MELTGKCKQDFEKWLLDFYIEHIKTLEENKTLTKDTCKVFADFERIVFKNKPQSMQYGVYVDFFDSVGIFCEDRRYTDINMAWVVKYPNWNGFQDRFDGLTKTRQEARTKAIEKANEIYNEK